MILWFPKCLQTVGSPLGSLKAVPTNLSFHSHTVRLALLVPSSILSQASKVDSLSASNSLASSEANSHIILGLLWNRWEQEIGWLSFTQAGKPLLSQAANHCKRLENHGRVRQHSEASFCPSQPSTKAKPLGIQFHTFISFFCIWRCSPLASRLSRFFDARLVL